jgi:hypothetical protein
VKKNQDYQIIASPPLLKITNGEQKITQKSPKPKRKINTDNQIPFKCDSECSKNVKSPRFQLQTQKTDQLSIQNFLISIQNPSRNLEKPLEIPQTSRKANSTHIKIPKKALKHSVICIQSEIQK